MRRLKNLEEENAQLKKLVADLSLDEQILQDVLKKSYRAISKTGDGRGYLDGIQCCHLILLARSMYCYKDKGFGDELLSMRMKEIAAVRIRYGFGRLYILLWREGFKDNHKRMYRCIAKKD